MNVLVGLKLRIERNCAAQGLSYPWWIPAYSAAAIVSLDVAALVQRGLAPPPAVAVLAALIVLAPTATWCIGGRLFPPWVEAAMMLAGVALYLTRPASHDLAPWLLMMSTGELAAISPVVVGLGIAGVESAALVLAGVFGHLGNVPLYVAAVLGAADVGIALRWQMRALAAERAKSVIVAERATLSERQRVAREVHDVVGHALSITLLNVTAARHALTQHADIPDAIESLSEAERVGRSAMTDLRRTVAVLGADAGSTEALPGLDDLPALIARARGAGLDVCDDALAADALVPIAAAGAAAELGVYRIVQESLANIAKHAPATTTCIEACVDGTWVHVTVRNALPAAFRPTVPKGSGLPGMTARAEQMGGQLHAGPTDDAWVVELTLPLRRDHDAAPISPRRSCAR